MLCSQFCDGQDAMRLLVLLRTSKSGTVQSVCRVCVVNDMGHVLLDTHVHPGEKVTDYRTHVSGVRRHHLVDAPSAAEVQAKVAVMAGGRTLVGHALHNDLNVSRGCSQACSWDAALRPVRLKLIAHRARAHPWCT